jgi:hypothetical protein
VKREENLAVGYKPKLRKSSAKMNRDPALLQSWYTVFSGHSFGVRIISHTASALIRSQHYEMICGNLLPICQSSSTWQLTVVSLLEIKLSSIWAMTHSGKATRSWTDTQQLWAESRNDRKSKNINYMSKRCWFSPPNVTNPAPNIITAQLKSRSLEDSAILRCEAVSLNELFPKFRMIWWLHLQRQAV